jgi:excisionase family DNA binding protein
MGKSATKDLSDPLLLSYSISEWARLAGVSRQTVWRAIRKRQIRTVKVAGRKRIPVSEKHRLQTV